MNHSFLTANLSTTTMKFLIVFACALAAASAGNLLAPVAQYYPGSQHLPVIGANGVPVDTPAVQQAAAQHFVHKVEAHVRNGDYVTPYSYGSYPFSTLYRARRGVVAYNTYANSPVVASGYTTFPYIHNSAVLYRARRGVVAPVAYTGYAHAPVVATSAYTYPYAHNSAIIYRKRRGVVAPVVTAYAHTPVATAYSTFPYAHYF